ncbi:endonuclease dU [Halococcoides cellulosivorans]|uniref:UPF0215 protein HARCEL1_06070 n=1 Tax=Halococcoides cellulosivorans TaxID=1679096 RepID=A0A2R4X0I6_9EURY|nr:DUF99 family protein [Halococcoides cellulosivorans]AWB27297.1 DUF99 domain-containing protein [Halococcoides cellulosivorans]
MKSGARVLGIAASDADRTSTIAGAVVRIDRVVDGVTLGTISVGGRDATASVQSVIDRADRPDVAAVLIAGIAPAWFNVIDLHALDAPGPVISVSFEASPGLDTAIEREFEGSAREWRLATYRRQPERHAVSVDGETLYVRSVDASPDRARVIVRETTPEGGRPEPLRVARLIARAAAERRRSEDS